MVNMKFAKVGSRPRESAWDSAKERSSHYTSEDRTARRGWPSAGTPP